MQNNARLKIWVCEFVSAGGLSQQELPQHLLQEGVLMRDALLRDLHALGHDCITSHDARVPAPALAYSQLIPENTANIMHFWQQQMTAHAVDVCWVIAPETDGILQQMQTMVTRIGKPWVGCDADAIRLTSDKALMAQHCAKAGIAVIPHLRLDAVNSDTQNKLSAPDGWIIKPIDGAGCEHTYYFENITQVIDFKNTLTVEDTAGAMQGLLVQPYVRGQAVSFSAIASHQAVQVVAGHQQTISITNHEVHFAGVVVNAAAKILPWMQAMATQLKTAIPGLTGYWGADLILQDDGQLVLVEINPRLTTSYIALSGLMAVNPAGMILEAVLHQRLLQTTAQGTHTLQLDAVTPPCSVAETCA